MQDLLTVLTGGGMQIPSIFMIGLVYRILASGGKDNISGEYRDLWAVWAAFAGGILWDLRWAGIPGFYTLGYVIVVMIVVQVWRIIPPQGRLSGNYMLVFWLMELSQLIPPLVPVLILGGKVGWNFFLTQQVYSLPVILLGMYMYRRKVKRLV